MHLVQQQVTATMKKTSEKIDSVVTAINRRGANILAAVVAVYLLLWLLVMVLGIIGRTFLGWGWLFLEEYTAYFNMVVGGLGLAYAVVEQMHIKVDVLVRRLPKRARLVLECISAAICAWWGVVLAQKMSGWFFSSVNTGAVSDTTRTPLWIPYLIAFIALACLALTTLLLFLHVVLQTVSIRGSGK